MIRKIIIVVLTLGVVCAIVAWVDSYRFHQVNATNQVLGTRLGERVVLKDGDICRVISWRVGWLAVEQIENCIPVRQAYLTWFMPGMYLIQRWKIFQYVEYITADGSRAYQFAIRAWVLVVGFGAYPLFALQRGPIRRWRRKRKGLCFKCSYNLKGNVSGICPECGLAIEPAADKP